MEIRTDPAPIEDVKRLDLVITFPTGTTVTHTVREEYGDKWDLRDGILKIRLYKSAEDREPSAEWVYFAGHLAGIGHRNYTMRVRKQQAIEAIEALARPGTVRVVPS